MSSENKPPDAPATREVDIREEIKRDRLADLRNARNELQAARRTTRQMMTARKDFDEQLAGAHYLDEFKALLLELKAYGDIDEITQRYWHGFEENQIPNWWVYPPAPDSDEWEKVGPGNAPSAGRVEPILVAEFNGLIDFLEAPPRSAHTFRCARKPLNMELAVYQAEVTSGVPRECVDMGVDLAFRFMSYVGLDVDLAKSQQDIELEYSTLLADESS